MFMEISKFMIKAKRILDKTWAIGYYFKIGNKDFIGVPISATNESNSDIEWNEIDPNTICRSTGVFDRTGEMLFENDNFIYYKINSSERYHSVACYNEKEGKWCCEDGRPLFSIINMDYELNVTQNMFDYPSKNEGSIDWTSLVETKPTDVVSIFECKTSSKEQPVYTVIRIKHEKDTGETILCAFIVNMKFYVFSNNYTTLGKETIQNWLSSEYGKIYDSDENMIKSFNLFAGNQKFVILANILTASWDINRASYTTKVFENDYFSINAEIDRIKSEY